MSGAQGIHLGHLWVPLYPVTTENKQLQQLQTDKGQVTKGSDSAEMKVWITPLESNQANWSIS